MTVLTIGTFDPPHGGHAAFLRKVEDLTGQRPLVGVNTDQFVWAYKAEKCVYTLTERVDILSAMGYETYLNDDGGLALIREVSPSILAIGSDWHGRYLPQIGMTQKEADLREMAFLYVPYTAGISSSDLKARLNTRRTYGAPK